MGDLMQFQARTIEPVPDMVPDAAMDGVALKAYRRLVEAWGLTDDEAAALADAPRRTWARMKRDDWSGRLGQDQRLRLSGLVGLYKGLRLYFSDEVADRWVKRPNGGPLFRGVSPLAFMRAGGLPAILRTRDYMDAVRGGV